MSNGYPNTDGVNIAGGYAVIKAQTDRVEID